MNVKATYLFFILPILFAFSAEAQQTGGWDGWTTVYTDDAYPSPHEVQISFKQNPVCLGTSYYRTKSNFSLPNSYVSFNYDYLDCDGKPQTENLMVFLDTPKVEFSSTGSWYIGAKIVTRSRNVVPFLAAPPNSNNGSTSNSVTSSNQTAANTTNIKGSVTNNATNSANTNNSGLNAQQQQTQQYINNAQNNSGDAIQQATALNLARIQARVRNGSTALQQQQIQQQQNASNAQATNNLTGALGNLISTISSSNKQNNTPPPPAEDNNAANTYNPPPTYTPPPANNNAHNDPPAANALINTKAPDIDFTETNGSVFKLSNYTGKKVLLVFWASYNDNSIAQFNLIKSYYPFLTIKHITVVGIAEEFSRYQWETAVKDNALPGLQLSELNGTGNDTYENYKITELPTLFFINALGYITAVSNTFSGIKPQIQ